MKPQHRSLIWSSLIALSLGFASPVLSQEEQNSKGDDMKFERAVKLLSGDGVKQNVERGQAILQALGEDGDGRALERLGVLHQEGTLLPQDNDAAEEYFIRAASAGRKAATLRLAEIKAIGSEFEQSRDLFGEAIELGVKNARARQAMFDLQGRFGPLSDREGGLRTLIEAANAGDLTSTRFLADAYFAGEYIPQNFAEARELYVSLAASGDARANERIGDIYSKGLGVPADPTRAAEAYLAAADAGRHKAYLKLAGVLSEIGMDGASRDALQKGHDLGEEDATVALGIGHLENEFGGASDPEVGRKLLRSVADTNDKAAYALAEAYRRGKVIKRSKQRAFDLHARLADSGDARSMRRMGQFYAEGFGVEPDGNKALEYFESALNAGRTAVLPEMAEVLLRLERGEEALPLLEKASELSIVEADLVLARGHLTGVFGGQSSTATGSEILATLISTDNPRANLTALEALSDGVAIPVDIGQLATASLAAIQNGSTELAEPLFSFLQERPESLPNSAQVRLQLVETVPDALNARDVLIERISIAARGPQNRSTFVAMMDAIDAATVDNIAAGVRATRNISDRAYTFIIQELLRRNGYRNSEPSGLMDRTTLRQVSAFCVDHEISDVCRNGPMRGAAAQAIGETFQRLAQESLVQEPQAEPSDA